MYPKKTVDQWLEEVNYHNFNEYIPSNFALEMILFIKLVNGDNGVENKTPVVHMKVFDEFTDGDGNIINLCHRGFAKSTLMEYLIFYIAVNGELPNFGDIGFILYVSDSIENGIKTMRKSLEYRWQNSEFLQKWLPDARFTDVRWDFWDKTGRHLVVKGYGAKTGIRGTREDGGRPVLALVDDILSDDDARSPTVIAAIEDTIYKAIDYALHPTRRKIIWNGTPFNANDPLYKAVESGAWKVNVFPVAERWYDGIKREEFFSSWPDRFTYDAVKKQYEKSKASGREDSFYQEMMLMISPDTERLISENDIRWYSGIDLNGKEHRYNWYITTDFAVSNRDRADYSVISLWAYNSAGQWMLHEGKIGRNTMDKNIDIIFDLVVKYNVREVGIETNGQQKGFVSWMQREMHTRNIYFRLNEVRRSSDKLTYIHNMVPMFRRGEIWMNTMLKGTKYYSEMIDELKKLTPGEIRSAHDDWLDTMSMLQFMHPWKPADYGNKHEYNGDDPFSEEVEEEASKIDSYLV